MSDVLAYSALYAAVATQVETVTGTAASRQPISVSNVPATLGDIPYSIKIDSVRNSDEGRSRGYAGVSDIEVTTSVEVTIARKLVVDAQIASYKTLLDNAQNVIEACVSPTAITLATLLYDRLTTAVATSGEWVVATIRFLVGHRITSSTA